MERAATEAQTVATRNPRLKVLLGYADEERAKTYREQKKFPAAFDAIDRALAVADFHRFHEERAWILRATERDKEALAELEQAVFQEPQNDDYLAQRGSLRLDAGKLREGTDDLKAALLLDPTANRSAAERGTKKLIYEGYQRYIASDRTGALAAYDMALELSPGNVDALERKARVSTGSDAVSRLEAAAVANPNDFNAYKQLDDELVKTREFPRIVAHWDRYIAANPDDARAYYERGGANFHAGNSAAAIADLDRACAAGNPGGCEGARHVRARTH
jgi:tetratricopeptide (TPR) repeat protein